MDQHFFKDDYSKFSESEKLGAKLSGLFTTLILIKFNTVKLDLPSNVKTYPVVYSHIKFCMLSRQKKSHMQWLEDQTRYKPLNEKSVSLVGF